MYRTEIWQPPVAPNDGNSSTQINFIDNSADEANWIVVENRLSMPLGVGSINRATSTKLNLMQAVPPLYKACLPIDPNGDVELSIGENPNVQWAINQLGLIASSVMLWSGSRSVSYTLMPDGSMGQWPLYPFDSCMPVTRQLTIAAGAEHLYIAGPVNITGPGPNNHPLITGLSTAGTFSRSYKENAPSEACIMYAQVTITSLAASSNAQQLIMSASYGTDAVHGADGAFVTDISLFGALAAAGGSIATPSNIVPCMGASAIAFSNVSATAIQLFVTFWLGIPTVPIQ